MIDGSTASSSSIGLPNMKAVIDMRTWDIDGFCPSMRALSDQPEAQ